MSRRFWGSPSGSCWRGRDGRERLPHLRANTLQTRLGETRDWIGHRATPRCGCQDHPLASRPRFPGTFAGSSSKRTKPGLARGRFCNGVKRPAPSTSNHAIEAVGIRARTANTIHVGGPCNRTSYPSAGVAGGSGRSRSPSRPQSTSTTVTGEVGEGVSLPDRRSTRPLRDDQCVPGVQVVARTVDCYHS